MHTPACIANDCIDQSVPQDTRPNSSWGHQRKQHMYHTGGRQRFGAKEYMQSG